MGNKLRKQRAVAPTGATSAPQTAKASLEAVFKNPEQGQRLSAANTQFALNLYKLHTSSTNGNVFMSPLSICVALAMTYVGARGETKSQMKNVLHFTGMEDDHIHEAFTDIQSALNKPNQPYKLYMANWLFGEKSYTFLKEFLAAGRKHYAAKLAAVDFRNDSSGSAAVINNWVSEKTNNKVPVIVDESAIDEQTRLILVNAVYFKGEWLQTFDAHATRENDFHVSQTETVKVQMMYMQKTFYYGESDNIKCQVIELPYVGKIEFLHQWPSMFIILPSQSVTLAEVEKKLTSDDLMNARERFQMASTEVKLWLPKFQLDEKLSLVEALSGMGIKDLFVDGAADLSGVDGSRELYVSKVLHRAVVDVNEEGTEAAAATAMTYAVYACILPLKTLPQFRADHPFLFFIQHNATKSILFLGRLVKPPSA